MLLFALVRIVAAAETELIDFDVLSGSPDFQLTDQIPGILFDSIEVITPATIGNSPGIPLSAATSGSSAAFSFGAKIYFSNSVIRVQMTLSPSFITVPLSMETYWETAYLTAYKRDGTVLSQSQAQIIAAVAKNEDVTNFTPSVISVSSSTPIAYVSIDLDDPFSYSGTSFFFDDLILTLAQPAEATRPTIRAVPWLHGTVDLSWGFFNCDLQWTTNLASGQWRTAETTNTMGYTIDPSKAPTMYFRVKRLLPPQ
jgi:hypothetical protein